MLTLYRIFKNAVKNLWRNKWLTVATVTVMTLTLFTVSVFVVLNILVNSTIDTIKSRIDLEVYFNQDVAEDEILAVKNEISKLEEVKDVYYISKKQALEIFKEQNKDDPALYETITEEDNPLPASLKIDLFKAEELDKVNALFRGGKYDSLVEDTSYENNKLIVQKLINIGNYIKKGGLILSLIFIITTLIVVLNTIRMTIYTRREEIEIMKLVGATNWYIRWPFVLEGAFYGLISVVISSIVIFAGLKFLNPYISFYLQDFSTNFYEYLKIYSLEIIGLQFLISISVGVISSLIAMGKYLRV